MGGVPSGFQEEAHAPRETRWQRGRHGEALLKKTPMRQHRRGPKCQPSAQVSTPGKGGEHPRVKRRYPLEKEVVAPADTSASGRGGAPTV